MEVYSLLPFLKKNTNSSIIVQTRTPDASSEPQESDEEIASLEIAIDDFMKAFRARDTKKMALILKVAHEILHEYMNTDSTNEEP